MSNDAEDVYDDGYGDKENHFLVNKKELDELKQYFEMNNNDLMLKSLQLMYDILQAQKVGWKFGFMKVLKKGNEEIFDTEYFPNVIPFGLEKVAMPNVRVNWKEFKNLKIDY